MQDNTRNQGYIHLYTGNGKGKTSAALGLAIRAVGAGKRVFIGQFVKGMHYSELESLKRFDEIVIKQYGRDCFIEHEPTDEDIKVAIDGLNEVTSIVKSNEYNVVILDEICIALYYKLFPIGSVVSLLKEKPKSIEIVLTGRYAPTELIEIADLVTEMKEIKHYYNKGVEARKGFEF
ncbi:MAG: cob(I)yrinic acid a,c-diamide adenosyltransferase [Bacteroidales bacterium]|nr:cob(I)yrinic acid a,c-diamide adenosyltransferase [Bacteroidales bacterium]MDD3892052.1 cob(I)yrinic acid a,c-diamide adenosyltransferase [Bacteroidales bacterium]